MVILSGKSHSQYERKRAAIPAGCRNDHRSGGVIRFSNWSVEISSIDHQLELPGGDHPGLAFLLGVKWADLGIGGFVVGMGVVAWKGMVQAIQHGIFPVLSAIFLD